MTDSLSPDLPKPRRLEFKRVLSFLLHPRQETARLVEEQKASWLTPMLVSSLTLIVYILVSGFLKARAAAMGEIALPADWQWWTPDMQNNYMQAVQATQGPVFLYIIPLVLGLAKLWLGWAVAGGLLHLVSTLLGGRGTMVSALNVVGWARLVFAVRDLLRVVFMLAAGRPIASAGLSGFSAAPFLAQILSGLDIFLIWYAVLLAMGLGAADSLPRSKAIAGSLIVLVIILLATAGLGALSANLSGMMITRPFF